MAGRVAVSAILTLVGCLVYDWRAAVTRQAAFDHSCPLQRITVIRDNGDPTDRAVVLDVCGNTRMYRDMGGTETYLWQDMSDHVMGTVTAPRCQGTPQGQGASPTVTPTVQAPVVALPPRR